MLTPNPKVSAFLAKSKNWQAEMQQLRNILLTTPLTEDLKWGHPCYTIDDKNIVLIGPFKNYCALLFPKGALLKDPDHILIQPTENSQAGRQIRFTSLEEIARFAPVLKTYIQYAIDLEKSGAQIPYKKTADFKIPSEFKTKLAQNPRLRAAFSALTPGRQRAYLLYFSAPKQSKTRDSRIDKHTNRILNGKGLND